MNPSWYNRSKSRSDSNVRPLSLMGSLTISSLSGSDLVKSLVNHHNHDSAEDEEDETAQGQGVHVNTYDTFMKKHLSSYGYYCNGRLRMELSEYDQRLGANDPGDFPTKRFAECELVESKSSESALVDDLMQRTTQIVLDPESGKGPKLKEPRQLFHLGADFRTEPKYPTHFPVVQSQAPSLNAPPPPHPEQLYAPHGKEAMPQPVGSGDVVYLNDPGEEEFFTRSRVQGRPVRPKPVAAEGTTKGELQFESRFESGNLHKATKVGDGEYELELRNDLYTNRHTQWYNFQIKNMKANKEYRLTITNLSKPSSLYNLGLKPLIYSESLAKLKNLGWHRSGENIKYYKKIDSDITKKTRAYCLTFTIEFPCDNDTVYLAHDYPYTYTDLQHYLADITTDSVKSKFIKSRILCKSLAGNSVHILTISNPSKDHLQSDDRKKKMILITARVHPGETNGSWMMKGFLDYVLSDDPDAFTLRDNFIFKVIPMLNPDGVIVGNYRCSLAGRDLNRRYKTSLRDAFPPVWHTRLMVQRITRDRPIALYIDLHGHSRKHNVFMYGCKSSKAGEEKIFPYMMGLNARNSFSYDSCKYKLQPNKEGTGRILMHRLGVEHSYTLEASFGGSTLGDRAGTHLGISDLEMMGKHICDTLLDYFDPDPTKRIYCHNEILNKIRADIIRKFGANNIPTDPGVLHDLESDTSGSNSSSDEGLPAHIQAIQEAQSKKKKRKTRKERQRIFDSRSSVKEPPPDVSRPKSAEGQAERVILEVPRTVRPSVSRRHVVHQDEKPVVMKKPQQTARLLVPLVPKDATLVQFTEKQPRHAAFSSPKKIVDIFNLNGKADHRQRADASKRPKYNYSTRWDKPDQMNAQAVRQTKYQAFSIENYLKHLLKANNRTHRERSGLGVSLGQLLSATRGAPSPECKNRLYEIIRERRYEEMPVINDYDSVQAMRELLSKEIHPTHDPSNNVHAQLKPRTHLAQVRHY